MKLLPVSLALSLIAGLAVATPRPAEKIDHNADIEVIDRALAAARPTDRWVKFGDVGIKYADLKVYRDRLARKSTSGAQPDVITPAGTTFKWPGGNVYYRFDPAQVSNNTITATKMQQFRDAVAEWTAFANLHFIENISGQSNYITVQEDPTLGGGFSSSVGMAGGEQFVKIGTGAWNRGTVCHEIGHALGLWHEQQRPDRDTYVIINFSNIAPADQPNFAIISNGQTFGTAYDFYSVMHYRRNDLSSNGLDTISMQPLYAQYIDVIGKVYDRTLSRTERAGMAAIYGNPSQLPSSLVTNTNDGGPGSFRTAIYYAFDKSTDVVPVPTTITFHIPTSDSNYNAGTGVFTIKPTYTLTALGNGTTIDGTSQTAFTGNTNPNGPEIVLDGTNFTALGQPPFNIFSPGLILRAANCTVKSLTIQNFNERGIDLHQGTDPNGSATTGNLIGGTTAAARNIISGNAAYGIGIRDSTTTGNIIQGNYVGTNQTGASAQSNGSAGIVIYSGAHGNTIGGAISGAGNVISGNGTQAIFIGDAGTNNNFIQGNLIGLNATGTAAIPNLVGIEIQNGAQSNTVGGTAAGMRNIISGNSFQGISIDGTGTTQNLVQGNYIGVDANGALALANGSAGISIFSGAQSNIIGGTIAAARNVISGNVFQGVTIDGASTAQNLVQGNFIGVNANGNVAIANGSAGISIYNGANNNTVGGTAAGMRNVISGNTFQALTLDGSATNSNIVAGNYIGLDASGITAIANTSTNIRIYNGAHDNVIGGTAAGSRNYICSSPFDGVAIEGSGTNNNLVQGNTIGLNTTGAARPNGSRGVAIFSGAQSNIVGGSTIGASNIISANSFAGIGLADSATSHNSFTRNSIFSNGGKGIVLNDSSNNAQSFPTLTSAMLSTLANPNGTDVQGSLAAAASSHFTIEFFASATGDASGFGEGQNFVGSTNVTTNGAGTVNFAVSLAAAVPAGNVITATATATDLNTNNTSEFSATRTVTTTDTDGDGMPDNWENAHTLNSGNGGDANIDSDGDGFTNIQEFRDGTDPRNAASRFTITSIDTSGGSRRINFTGVTGNTYRLEFRDDLVTGNWNTLTDQIVGTGALTQIVDPTSNGLNKRFYRLVHEP